MDRSTIQLTLIGIFLVFVRTSLANKQEEIDIQSFHLSSTVISRYAITVITSHVANRLNEAKEVHFEVKIPKNAFISKFLITTEGRTYKGVVKKKEDVLQQNSGASSNDENAGIISSVGRTLEEFKTSVTVAALSKVTFELTYEELLKRCLGKYQLLINAQPMQPVSDFKIEVNIHESSGFSFLDVKGELSSNELTNAITTTQTTKTVSLIFQPNPKQQTICKNCGENGLNGNLLIVYDVERQNPEGELQVLDGYFVHYFAPTDIQRIPKNIVFVIDKSSSMAGRKVEQTRLALLKILEDLSEDDYFGLLTFNHQVERWKPELLPATPSNVQQAMAFVRDIQVRGSTNLNSALLEGLKIIKRYPRESTASTVLLLTDGDPTSGETDIGRIQANVKEAIGGEISLYCLGFGFAVKFEFLEKMALENNGVARRVYEDSDAHLQLQGFCEELGNPLLTNVQLRYTGAVNVTQTWFSQYHKGSEIVVAGQLTDNSLETFQTDIKAISKRSNVTYQRSVSTKHLIDVPPLHEHFIQRLWGYLTVKQQLEKELILDEDQKKKAKQKIEDFSVKFNFVTPLTSMVVTKLPEEETHVILKPVERRPRPKQAKGKKVMYFSNTSHLTKMLFSDPVKGFGISSIERPLRRPDLLSITRGSWPNIQLNMRATKMPSTSSLPARSIRFLISSHDQHKPVCYDVPTGHILILLSDASSEFYMNGRLLQDGFEQILVHFKMDYDVLLTTSEIYFYNGLEHGTLSWDQEDIRHESNGNSLILRKNEVEVIIGSLQIAFVRHEKGNSVFLWPAIHKHSESSDMHGLFGKHNLQYEELPGSVIKIKEKEVNAKWTSAVDYRVLSAPTTECWLVPFEFAMQGELFDYSILQL